MMTANWREFWRTYRVTEIEDDKDLFFEVGKTVNREPISDAAFALSVQLIGEALNLTKQDRLLELCCGNGLMTKVLAPLVEQIHAVDFVERLIQHAIKFRSAPNVQYVCADAIDYVGKLRSSGHFVPSKILLGDALAYFDPSQLRRLLSDLKRLTNGRFVFMATGIPSEELKLTFYNTPERIHRYEENQLRADNTNDGIGRWWQKKEFEEIGRELGLRVTFREQPATLSSFRLDAVVEPKS